MTEMQPLLPTSEELQELLTADEQILLRDKILDEWAQELNRFPHVLRWQMETHIPSRVIWLKIVGQHSTRVYYYSHEELRFINFNDDTVVS